VHWSLELGIVNGTLEESAGNRGEFIVRLPGPELERTAVCPALLVVSLTFPKAIAPEVLLTEYAAEFALSVA